MSIEIKRDIDNLVISLIEQMRFLKKSCSEYDKGDESEAKRIAATLRTILKDKGRIVSCLSHINKKNIKFFNCTLPSSGACKFLNCTLPSSHECEFLNCILPSSDGCEFLSCTLPSSDECSFFNSTLPSHGSCGFLNCTLIPSGPCGFVISKMSNCSVKVPPIFMGAVVKYINGKDNEFECNFKPFLYSELDKSCANWLDFQDWYDQPILVEPIKHHALTRRELIENISEKDGGVHVDDDLPEKYFYFTQNDALKLTINEVTMIFNNNAAYASVRNIAGELFCSVIHDEYLRNLLLEAKVLEEYKQQ